MSDPIFDFKSLRDLHDSVNTSLRSPHTKLEIIRRGEEKSAQDLSEASLRMADSCDAVKDLVVIAKDHLLSLQSSFRRIAAADHANEHFASQRLPRKQLKKAILKRLDSLRNAHVAAASPPEDRILAAVVDLLEEARSTILSTVRSLLSLIALPKSDSCRKGPVFGLRLTRVDSLRSWEKRDAADIRAAVKRLEEVEMVVEDMEAELEHMFRRLISTRASLLNILMT